MSLITQTPRITIREFLPEELETYLTHFTDEKVALHLPKRSREERINIFNNALNRYAVTKIWGTWGMFDPITNHFIGSCLLRPFNDDPTILEVGYSMEQKYWGQGIGTEMALAMVHHAFAESTITAVVAVTTLENIASQRVLEKAGLKRDGNLVREGEELAFFSLRK